MPGCVMSGSTPALISKLSSGCVASGSAPASISKLSSGCVVSGSTPTLDINYAVMHSITWQKLIRGRQVVSGDESGASG